MRNFAPLILATLLGCAASIRPDVSVTYVSEDGVTPARLAMLPVTAGEGLEGFRRMTADSLHSALVSARPEIEVIPADSTLRLLNDAGLAQRYSDMVLAYDRTGILDKETLSAIGEALDADHLLHVEVTYGAGKSTDYNLFTGLSTTRNQRLSIFAHLWSPGKGDVVWEAAGGAAVEATELQRSRSIPEILAVACKDLALKFPSGPLSDG